MPMIWIDALSHFSEMLLGNLSGFGDGND